MNININNNNVDKVSKMDNLNELNNLKDLTSNIKEKLSKLCIHRFVKITKRGNYAIDTALSLITKNKKILIPNEGGWIHYKKAPEKLGLEYEEVKCNSAKIDVDDLREKLVSGRGIYGAFLYQNPGGYFAKQPMREIYEICSANNCLVILDVSGSIGTELCDGKYANIIVGSFGKWKLVEARVGGFISCNDEKLFEKFDVEELRDLSSLEKINEKIDELSKRIKFLLDKRKEVIKDLKDFEIVSKDEIVFVVIVKFNNDEDKGKIIKYCDKVQLPYTTCPRYVRINEKAISVELKRLEGKNES